MRPTERFLTTRELAELRRVEPQTLRKERMRGTGPAYIRTGKPGSGRVLYKLADVLEWLEQRKVSSTAEEHVRAARAR